MRIFVTGGSGFIGGHLIERLTREHDVLAMARSEESARQVAEFGATPVRAGLERVTASHLGGAEAVVHAAARAEDWGTREQFYETNVMGTERMIAAARQGGVRRFVYVGTEAAFFTGEDLEGIDETVRYPERHRFLYSETKALAEQRVLAANSETMTTVSIRPRFVWGPRDSSVLAAITRMAASGNWAWIDEGKARTSTTHVANLVDALVLALDHGDGGEAYFVADDGEPTIREFVGALAQTQGIALPDRNLPGAVARPLSSAVEGLWRLLRFANPPPMTTFGIAMMGRTVTVRTDKARRDLDWTPRVSIEEGLAALGAPGAAQPLGDATSAPAGT